MSMPELLENTASVALRASRDRLKAISGQLGAFLTGSEDVFLDAGSRLVGVERQARGLLESARGALTVGAGLDHPLEELHRELDRLDDYLRATRDRSMTGLTSLARLTECAEAIVRTRQTFESIPPTLRMLGMNTRIENSRAGAQNVEMETVAADVRRLGDLIEPKFRAVFEQASGLLQGTAGARETAETFVGRQAEWSTKMLKETRVALQSLRALSGAEEAVVARAVESSEQLARDLAGVLVALQGHDATRQMVEHAVEELGSFEQDVTSAMPVTDADAGAWLAHLPDLCRLISAQIGGARERFLQALRGISGNLSALAARGAELCNQTAGVAEGGAKGSLAEQVILGVGEATRVLRDHVAHECRSTDGMRGVVERVNGMAAHVREIEGIGTAVKIIALNALVKTARAGEGGRVLAVLAQGMGGLAAEVVRSTGEVSQILEEISTLAGTLSGATVAGEASQGAGIASALDALTVRLSEHRSRVQQGAQGIHVGSQELREAVEGIARRIAERAATARCLEALEQELERIGEGAARHAGQGGGAVRPPGRRTDAYERYTMHAERVIHDRVLNGVERSESSTSEGSVSEGGASDLGSNVELF
ncbi:MAG TPA: methyl-accepting chemotaxis protein [Anaeromyxobacteraceae bacterium]|nr:methyl-accepting chemotaxis protein [Anaeromyxobacteraceae bacterium]